MDDTRLLLISEIDYEPKEIDKDILKDLSDSIRENGMLHAIAVQPMNGKFKLIAGMKRLEAVKLLGFTNIEAKIISDEYDADRALEVTIAENLCRHNLPWWEQATLIKELHELRQREKGVGRSDAGRKKTGWSMRDTAQELSLALGTVSEAINLAHAVKYDPSLKNIQDRRTALRLVKNKAKQIESEQLAGIKIVDIEEDAVYCGPSFEVLKRLPDSFIHAVITDPPWLEFRDKTLTRDDETVPVFKELYRVMKWDSFLYVIVGIDDFFFYRDKLKEFGFQVQNYPNFWAKTGVLSYGVRPWEYQRNYEMIVVAVKGNPVHTVSTQLSAIYNYPVITPSQLTHQNEKPVGLIKEIMRECTYDGSFVLDPFGGSGVVGEAAIELNRRYIIIERDHTYYEQINKRLERVKESKRR